MYDRAQMKQEVKKTIAATRPRPMWITLLFAVIVGAGAWVLQSIISRVGTVGMAADLAGLTDRFAQLLYAYEGNWEVIFAELLYTYGYKLVDMIGILVSTSVVSSILVGLWQALMNAGYIGYSLSMVRGEQPGVSRVFCGFPLVGKVILNTVLVWVFTTLWTLLYLVCFVVVAVIGALLMEPVPALGVIIMLLGYIAFIIMEVRLVLRYAMTNYILLDTGKCGLAAITESKRMMKGNKGKLFMLELSFIGWYLLLFAIVFVAYIIMVVVIAIGAASAGFGGIEGLIGAIIGALVVLIVMAVALLLFESWLRPYISGSVAKFYLSFKQPEPAESLGWPQADDPTASGND